MICQLPYDFEGKLCLLSLFLPPNGPSIGVFLSSISPRYLTLSDRLREVPNKDGSSSASIFLFRVNSTISVLKGLTDNSVSSHRDSTIFNALCIRLQRMFSNLPVISIHMSSA